jgi:RNA polymerase sigma-70 factor (ECF subfamily)
MMKKRINQYNDTELAAMLRQRRKIAEAAFTELYNRYSTKIYTYCVCMVGNPDQASDVFQETFIRFHKYAKKKETLDNVSGYLMKIARNQCINHKRDRRQGISLDNFDFAGDIGVKYEQKETFEMIMTAIDLLDEKYREPFVLREFDGLAYKDIAEVCDLSLSNAKSRVARARHQLAEVLDPYIKNKC